MSTKSALIRFGRSWAVRCWNKASVHRLWTGVKKKTLCRYGKIEIAGSHSFSQAVHGYQISPYMQEKMVYAGQWDCYSAASEMLSRYLLVEVSTTQVQRLTNTYGRLLENEPQGNTEEPEALDVGAEEVVYAQCDGSMILTRKAGFKEVKVGRIFKESDVLKQCAERGWIKSSEYEAWLGGHKTFCHRFEEKLDSYRHWGSRLVFISDGARWIQNWISDAYPSATHILDWYHAIEHLGMFAETYFDEEGERGQWIEQQKALLWESEVEAVLLNIKALRCHSPKMQAGKKALLAYYEANKTKMDYRHYRSLGAGIIGSGAIEAAHRSLIQKRLKQSGQRWSKKGAQNVIALRCANFSKKWNKVVELITATPLAA